jgi:hypothetical protein
MNVDTNQLFDCTRSSTLVQDTLKGIIQGNGLNCAGSNNTLSLAPNLTASHDNGGSLSTSSPLPTVIHSSSSSGLSTGAKIGIGIGIPIFVILVVAIFFVLFRRRKSREGGGITQMKQNSDRGDTMRRPSWKRPRHLGNWKRILLGAIGKRREDG